MDICTYFHILKLVFQCNCFLDSITLILPGGEVVSVKIKLCRINLVKHCTVVDLGFPGDAHPQLSRGENRLMFCAAIFYDVSNFHLFQ